MAKKKKRLKQFAITPFGFSHTWYWSAETEEQALKEFVAFQKKNFKWTRDEWSSFLENSMGNVEVDDLGFIKKKKLKEVV